MITSNSFKTPVKKDEPVQTAPVQVESPEPEALDTTDEEVVE